MYYGVLQMTYDNILACVLYMFFRKVRYRIIPRTYM